MYARIMVPLDGTPFAETALPHAEAMATALGATVVLLRTVGSSEERPAAKSYLAPIAEHLRREGLQVEMAIFTGEDPAEAIVKHAGGTGVDLIVMATRGLTGLNRMVLGSIADRVLNMTGIPLLLIRPDSQ